jgi:hypothetical protein
VVGEQSLEAFKNNTSFAKITVAQNLAEIPPEVRQKAAQRLSQLTGESVLPTPQRIAEQANTHLPRFQSEVQPLPRQLGSLGIDTERLDRLQRSLIEAQGGDGAEATRLFGSEASEIFDDLLWARKIKSALEKGAAELLGNVAKIQKQVQALDAQGALPELQAAWSSVSATLLQNIQEGTFAEDLPALGTQIDELNAQIAGYVQTYVLQQQQLVLEQIEGLQLSADFKSLPPEIQAEMTPKIQGCLKPLEPTLEGIQKAGRLTNESLAELQNIRGQIQKALKPAPVPAPIQPSPVSATPAPVPPSAEHPSVATVPVATATIRVPAVLRTAADLDALLLQLTALRDQLAAGNAVNLSTAP